MADRRSWILSVAHALRRSWWYVRRPIVLGAAGLVFDEDGRVLLIRHSYSKRHWTLPGGSVKRNESMSDAARRELREEAGVVVGEADDAMELFGLYVSYRDFNSNHIAVFLVREWTRVESHDREIANSGFFAPDALPAPMSGATIRRLDECLGRRPATGAW